MHPVRRVEVGYGDRRRRGKAMTLHILIAWAAAISAFLAAVFWVMAARAREDAPPETAGVGALLGGYLVSRDAKGRYDLHRTLEKQSRWNSCAAWSAAVAAVLSIGLLLC